MAVNLNKNNFEAEILSDIPVLVDFWAAWCGPCRAQAPILDKLESDPSCNVKVCKVDVDSEEELARRFGIVSIPTLIVFKNGHQTKKVSGVQSLESLKQLIN